MKTLVALTLLLLTLSGCAYYDYHTPSYSRSVHVRSYTRRDGTYVRSHYRTRPDGIRPNNYSYRRR